MSNKPDAYLSVFISMCISASLNVKVSVAYTHTKFFYLQNFFSSWNIRRVDSRNRNHIFDWVKLLLLFLGARYNVCTEMTAATGLFIDLYFSSSTNSNMIEVLSAYCWNNKHFLANIILQLMCNNYYCLIQAHFNGRPHVRKSQDIIIVRSSSSHADR